MTRSGSAPTRRPRIRYHRLIIVSGLPASGKTTIARQLAPAFKLPLFDKDDILEALFDTIGSVDLAARQQLSRASDQVLRTLVARSSGAVVTSFWRHPADAGSSGTPCGWPGQLSRSVVEVHCQCAPEVALDRFLHRSRHSGHHDAARDQREILAQFHCVSERRPLGVGRLVVVETTTVRDVQPVIGAIEAAFQGQPTKAP